MLTALYIFIALLLITIVWLLWDNRQKGKATRATIRSIRAKLDDQGKQINKLLNK